MNCSISKWNRACDPRRRLAVALVVAAAVGLAGLLGTPDAVAASAPAAPPTASVQAPWVLAERAAGTWTLRATAGDVRLQPGRAVARDGAICLERADGTRLGCGARMGHRHLAPRHSREAAAHAETHRDVAWFRANVEPGQPVWLRDGAVWLRDGPAARVPVGMPLALATTASEVSYEWLHHGGASADAFDIVVVGDGFTAKEKAAFFLAANQLAVALTGWGPYGNYAALLNIHGLFVASNESGADHPSQGVYRDTAFDTAFDVGGIERLAVADDAAVLALAGSAFPDMDLALVLVNDTAYGGSGGTVPVASRHAASVHILRHELAHTLSGVADEYTAAQGVYPPGDAEPNVTSKAHLQPLKWQHWVTPGTPVPTPDDLAVADFTPVGAFEGARYQAKGMFRPAPACLMRTLDKAFCPVCEEAMVLALAQATTTLRARFPLAKALTCSAGTPAPGGPPACPVFQVQTAALTHLQVQWRRGDMPVGTGPTWQPGPGDVGQAVLVAEVADKTPVVRSDPNHDLVEWTQWDLTVLAGRPPSDQGDAAAAVDAGQDDVAAAEPPANPPANAPGCATATVPSPAGFASGFGLFLGAWALCRRVGRWRARRYR